MGRKTVIFCDVCNGQIKEPINLNRQGQVKSNKHTTASGSPLTIELTLCLKSPCSVDRDTCKDCFSKAKAELLELVDQWLVGSK